MRLDQCISVEELEAMPDALDAERVLDASTAVSKVQAILRRLKRIDRDVMLLYLEGFEAREIAEVVGISQNLAAQKVHRAKNVLRRHLLSGGGHDSR
jgi:RNA polymerase sigma-70 factor (ECF subfamily)